MEPIVQQELFGSNPRWKKSNYLDTSTLQEATRKSAQPHL